VMKLGRATVHGSAPAASSRSTRQRTAR
jgi:hypothetical protein